MSDTNAQLDLFDLPPSPPSVAFDDMPDAVWEAAAESALAQRHPSTVVVEDSPGTHGPASRTMEDLFRLHPEWDFRLPEVWMRSVVALRYVDKIDTIGKAKAALEDAQKRYYAALRAVFGCISPDAPAFSHTTECARLRAKLEQMEAKKQWFAPSEGGRP